ncbi:MAG: TetR/AcrR family transcriptional regulator [Scytonema sp. PMC 1069.18]|nr:TetR/AcrR family transcriptional regulator [Scytonema sp. PMC 1069.18]MEC4887739.1 TetR/AcrR family transcriptional regulator [Scytonema sp. PMC 1070.18]
MNNIEQKTTQTRIRLLKAATEVFAKAGVAGATTKEIARVAGVNEVTLFRHFHSKEQLLGAVVQHVLALQAEALAHQDEWTQDLKEDLMHYGWLYNSMLEEHEALIRTFIGEAKRHPEEARRIISEAAQPLREKLIAYLSKAQIRGVVREDIDLKPTVDMFTGMLIAGMLRRSAIPPQQLGYSRQHYIETCISVFVRGISIVHTNSKSTS